MSIKIYQLFNLFPLLHSTEEDMCEEGVDRVVGEVVGVEEVSLRVHRGLPMSRMQLRSLSVLQRMSLRVLRFVLILAKP